MFVNNFATTTVLILLGIGIVGVCSQDHVDSFGSLPRVGFVGGKKNVELYRYFDSALSREVDMLTCDYENRNKVALCPPFNMSMYMNLPSRSGGGGGPRSGVLNCADEPVEEGDISILLLMNYTWRPTTGQVPSETDIKEAKEATENFFMAEILEDYPLTESLVTEWTTGLYDIASESHVFYLNTTTSGSNTSSCEIKNVMRGASLVKYITDYLSPLSPNSFADIRKVQLTSINEIPAVNETEQAAVEAQVAAAQAAGIQISMVHNYTWWSTYSVEPTQADLNELRSQTEEIYKNAIASAYPDTSNFQAPIVSSSFDAVTESFSVEYRTITVGSGGTLGGVMEVMNNVAFLTFYDQVLKSMDTFIDLKWGQIGFSPA